MSTVIPVNPVPLPIGTPLTQPRKTFGGSKLQDVLEFLRSQDSFGFLTLTWQQFLSQLQGTISASGSTRLERIQLSTQSASVGATDFSGGSISQGIYSVQPYARITTPATTGAATSSLILAIGWTEGGVSLSFSYPAMTGNLVTTVLTGPPLTIRVDTNSPITYTVTYASNTAGQMQYRLDLVLSRVAAI